MRLQVAVTQDPLPDSETLQRGLVAARQAVALDIPFLEVRGGDRQLAGRLGQVVVEDAEALDLLDAGEAAVRGVDLARGVEDALDPLPGLSEVGQRSQTSDRTLAYPESWFSERTRPTSERAA